MLRGTSDRAFKCGCHSIFRAIFGDYQFFPLNETPAKRRVQRIQIGLSGKT
jgi:hypothetical protein